VDSETYRRTRAAWKDIWRGDDVFAKEQATLDYARARRARSLYLPYLPKGEAILEAGCGVGTQLVELHRLGYSPVGLDYAENALRVARSFLPEAPLAAGDVHHIPLKDESVGAYLSFGVLEHFDFGPEPALAEARRVLRAGGVLVVIVPYPNPVWRAVRLRRSLRLPPTRVADYFETAYTAREMRSLVQGAGFAVRAQHPISHSFTLWGLGRIFRGPGYYETSGLAEVAGKWVERVLPWAMSFESMTIAQKTAEA
jgi:ubiquinone/menaquinone biosynthesis C-methylase UbiE